MSNQVCSTLFLSQEFDYFIYYSIFKLLLCSNCHTAINPLYFKGHLQKHLLNYKGKEKKLKIQEYTQLFQELEIESLENSFNLIINYSLNNSFSGFKELEILNNVFSCTKLNCTTSRLNKKNIFRHLFEIHQISADNANNFIKLISTAQSLENNKFCFQIQIEDINNLMNIEENHEENQSSIFNEAKDLLFKEFEKKNQNIYNKINIFSTNSIFDKLTPFQQKTSYSKFLENRDLNKILEYFNTDNCEKQNLINILEINLSNILYLSLEKSIYLNQIHCNILNSFQANITVTKGFKTLFNSSSRIKYIKFYLEFLRFILVTFSTKSYITQSLYILSSKMKELLQDLFNLAQRFENSNITNSNNKIKNLCTKNLNNLALKSLDFVDENSESENNSNSISTNSTNNIDLFNSDSDSENIEETININSYNILENIQELESNIDEISLNIQSKLVELLILFFKQETDLNKFTSSINSFFACKSIKNNFTLRDSSQLSPFYSQFIYCSQLIIIQSSFQQLINNNNNREIVSNSQSLVEIIKNLMQSCFQNHCATSLAEILNLRAYCFAINRQQSGNSNIIISNILPNTLHYKKITVNIADFKYLFKELIQQTYEKLIKDLLFDISISDIEDITLESFAKIEDINNNNPYECFRNWHSKFNYYNIFLREKVINNINLRQKFFILKNNKLEANRIYINLYLDKVKAFLKFALLLIHFTSGLPARGTEINILRFQNSIKDKREMFLDKGSNLFIIKLSYHKGLNIQDKAASNIRFLPSNISYIFLLYLVLVEPFVNFLEISSLAKKSLNPYLFFIKKNLLQSSDLSKTMGSFSNITISQKISIQSYRQIIVGIIKYFMQENIDEDNLLLVENLKENSTKEIAAQQMNHSFNTEELHYARNNLVFSNIQANLQLKYLDFCLRYFAFFDLEKIILNTTIFSSSNNILVFNLRNQYIEREKQRELNEDAIKYNKDISRKHKRAQSSINSSLEKSIIIKKTKLQDLDNLSFNNNSFLILNNLLKDFLQNSEATFKIDEQRFLIEAILLKIPYIFGILPTNSGKSLSYLLVSSLYSSKITIVIVPLVGLKLNLVNRAQEFNIPTTIWEENQNFKNLTFISIETLVNEYFIFKIQELIENDKLDRFIIDECHCIITHSNYRSIMSRINQIIALNTQFVFLTGTLPFKMEEQLKKQFFITESTSIRANCTRNDLFYQVKYFNSSVIQEQFIEIQRYIIESLKDFNNISEKIIIFVSSITIIKQLGEYLQYPIYYSSLENKEIILNDFLSNTIINNQVIITSSGLEEGLDYFAIKKVIYFNLPFSFIGFLQGSSRAGRGITNASSILFVNQTLSSFKSSDSEDQVLLKQYINEKICRRKVIDFYLNNNRIEKCVSTQILCDLCLSRSKITSTVQNNLKIFNQQIEANRIKLQKQLIQIQHLCIYCFLLEDNSNYKNHSASKCNKYNLPFESAFAPYKKSRIVQAEFFKFPIDSCCFKCLFPTVICTALKSNNDSQCFNNKIMWRFLFTLFKFPYNKYLQTCKLLGRNYTFSQLETFLKIFNIKENMEDLDTEALKGFQIFRNLLDQRLKLED